MSTRLKLYLIHRTDDADWDEYAGAVVAASTDIEAKSIHPGGELYATGSIGYSWVDPDRIKVTYLGLADTSIKKGVILSDFKG